MSLSPSPPPVRSDPEFRPVVSEQGMTRDAEPGAYRRILANPFLGFLALGLWCAALRWVLISAVEQDRMVALLAPLLAAGFALPWLFHYHCLDCGHTGPMHRWRRHVCPRVARRILEGRPRRFRGPAPWAQVVLWLYVLAIVLVVGGALGLGLR